MSGCVCQLMQHSRIVCIIIFKVFFFRKMYVVFCNSIKCLVASIMNDRHFHILRNFINHFTGRNISFFRCFKFRHPFNLTCIKDGKTLRKKRVVLPFFGLEFCVILPSDCFFLYEVIGKPILNLRSFFPFLDFPALILCLLKGNKAWILAFQPVHIDV